jgi:hypothetical protein
LPRKLEPLFLLAEDLLLQCINVVDIREIVAIIQLMVQCSKRKSGRNATLAQVFIDH